MLQGDNNTLSPAALRLYALLYELGADHTPVALPVADLAHRLGYSPCHIRRALHRLEPRYLRITRKGPRSTPALSLGSYHRVA